MVFTIFHLFLLFNSLSLIHQTRPALKSVGQMKDPVFVLFVCSLPDYTSVSLAEQIRLPVDRGGCQQRENEAKYCMMLI